MDELFHRYFSNEMDLQERLTFLQQIESDEQLKKEFVDYQNLHALVQLAQENRREDQRGYARFKKEKRKRQFYAQTLRWGTVAAILTFVILSTIRLTTSSFNKEVEATINKVIVPPGQRLMCILHDGTTVWLNAGSILTYPSRFTEKERRVSLVGEAFFEVAKERGRPFVVTAQEVEISVLGTKFNLESYPETSYVKTALLEGAVKVAFAQQESEGVILEPNQEVVVEQQQMRVTTSTNLDYLLWKEGVYSFTNEKLSDILRKLERYYDVKIVVNDPSIYQWEYTGKFLQSDGIDHILHIIRKIHRFTMDHDQENRVITLYHMPS